MRLKLWVVLTALAFGLASPARAGGPVLYSWSPASGPVAVYEVMLNGSRVGFARPGEVGCAIVSVLEGDVVVVRGVAFDVIPVRFGPPSDPSDPASRDVVEAGVALLDLPRRQAMSLLRARADALGCP